MSDRDDTLRSRDGLSGMTSKMLDKLLTRLQRHNHEAEQLAAAMKQKPKNG
jgi:hypothetical protein